MRNQAHPLYFNAGGRQLFGWLHPAVGAPRDAAVLICNPFGYEAICAYRSLRAFADVAAAAGMTAMRFDYSGTGDSEDADSNDDQLERWIEDVVAAVAELQRRSGARRVVLLGLRLGALLAALAARRSEAVQGLIAVAPAVNGRRHLRELRTFQAALGDTRKDAKSQDNEGDGSLEVSGFCLSAATVAHLGTIDLAASASAPRDVLIIDRDDLTLAKPWAEALQKNANAVSYRPLPGYVQMMTTPHATEIPQAMIGAIDEWLRRDGATEAAVERADMLESSSDDTFVTLSSPAGPKIRERAVFFAEQPRRFAIVTEPQADETRRRAVLLFNGGATYHIGPNRMYVSLARRWARRGYLVMRVDLAGLGDSATRPGRPDNEVYPPAAVDDMRAAIEFISSRYGTREITVGGLCAGAYHSLRAAVSGLPVQRILMVNPLTFFWKEGMTLSDLTLAEVIQNPSVYYRERIRSGRSWKKLVTGHVNLWRVIRILVQRAWLAAESRLRDLMRRLHIHLPNDLGWELERITARGVRIVFAFARGDTGVGILKIQAGNSVQRLGERCHLHIIEGGDHIFSQAQARKQLEDILSEELFAHPEKTVRMQSDPDAVCAQ